MTSHAMATALTLYRTRIITLEQAATAGGCTPEQLRTSARAVSSCPVDGTDSSN